MSNWVNMDKAYYDDLPHITKAGKNVYNAETYTGNWYEETVRNTLKRDEFLMKRQCGDLSIQRTQTMVDLLLKPIELSRSATPYLHYGDRVQIVSPGPSCRTAVEAYPFKRNFCKLAHLALSATVPPSSIDHSPYLSTDSIISVSPLLYPVVRNSFIIERPDSPSDTSMINYGDVFRIKAFQTQYFPLYLFSAPAIRLHVGSTHSAKPKVRFSDLLTADSLWCAHPMDPMLKLRMALGVPVSLKTRLLIKHNGSGNCLSMESKFPVLTYFGSEFEVTVDTKIDRAKQPTFENMWYFDTDRGAPKPTDLGEDEFEKQAEFSAKINVNTIHQSAADTAKEEEAARNKETEEYDDNNEQEQMMVATQQQMQQQQNTDMTREMMSQMSMQSRGPDGLRPYDPMTAPQPNAYNYRITDDDPFFPNKKWNCGDTDCCNVRPLIPPQSQQQETMKCEECPCIEPASPGVSPNATVNIKRLLM